MKQLKRLPKHLPPRDQNPLNKKYFKFIPKKIFQTWETNKVTPGMYDAVHTWIDKNPDWEYHFFDNDDCRNFIKDNFPKKVLAAYDTLIPGAYKADLWRYCVLYIHGGVYCDIKAELLVGLNDIIPEDVEFLSVKDIDSSKREFKGYIYQAFICTKPKHPFLKNVIDMLVENVSVGEYGHDSLSPTGPGLLGKAINFILKKDLLSEHVVGENNFSGFRYHLWLNDDSSEFCKDKYGKFLIHRTYANYSVERDKKNDGKLKKTYNYLWFFGGVFNHSKVLRSSPAYYDKYIGRYRALWVRDLYKNLEVKEARKEVFVAIKKRQLSFKLFSYFIKYELIYPFLKFLRLTK